MRLRPCQLVPVLVLVPLLLTGISPARASHGLITIQSRHSVPVTAEKLATVLKDRGMTVFSRIDHTAGAEGIGETIRPTLLFIFGNPVAGTALMKCSQTTGIDLPLKILIWEDVSGIVKLSYNDPGYIADRHGATQCGGVIDKMSSALKGIAEQASK